MKAANTPCRRRMIYGLRSKDQPQAPKPPEVPPVPKGVCPKCKQYIGRGVHFHLKSCKA